MKKLMSVLLFVKWQMNALFIKHRGEKYTLVCMSAFIFFCGSKKIFLTQLIKSLNDDICAIIISGYKCILLTNYTAIIVSTK